MTRQERVESLVHFLKHEREGYEAVPEPVDYEGKRGLPLPLPMRTSAAS